jgi:hypothetical protein
MGELDKILVLVDKYGIPIVLLVIFAITIGFLFKIYRDTMQAQQKWDREEHSKAIEYERSLRSEERAARLSAESRLESNTTALREATIGFSSAIAVMERQAEDDKRPARRSS